MQCAKIVFYLPKKNARIIARSIGIEVEREIPRTKIKLLSEGGKLTLVISSKDTNALRAAMNSYLRWIKVAEEVQSALETVETPKS